MDFYFAKRLAGYMAYWNLLANPSIKHILLDFFSLHLESNKQPHKSVQLIIGRFKGPGVTCVLHK